MKNFIKIISFLCVFLIIFSVVTDLLMRKQDKEPGVYTNMNLGYYEEIKDSIDVLYIGSSHMFSSVSPIDIWKKYGITGYVRGSALQRIWTSETVLKDSLKSQKPKVVVLEVSMAYEENSNSESFNREIYDAIKPSFMKYKDIYEVISADEDFISYVFPIIRYHSRWNNLNKNDFLYFVEDKNMETKGALLRMGVSPVEKTPNLYSGVDDYEEIPEKNKEHLLSIKRICEENNAELVLYVAPTQMSMFWNSGRHNSMLEFAEDNNCTLLDNNMGEYALDIDWQTETLDGGNHLNYEGAMKTTEFLGDWLAQNYRFIQHSEKVTKRWETQWNQYKKHTNERYLAIESSFNKYVDYLSESEDTIIISVNKVQGEDVTFLAKICGEDLVDGDVFVLSNNKVIYHDNYKNGAQNTESIKNDNIYISLSFSGSNGIDSSLEVDINDIKYNMMQGNINILVYDQDTEEFIDHSTFTAQEEEGVLTHITD